MIKIVACVSMPSRLIGVNNDLVYKIPEDLKFFMTNTIGRTVVMGWNTWLSLPICPKTNERLPNRRKIVITPAAGQQEGGHNLRFVEDPMTALKLIENLGEDVWIIGGGMVYEWFLGYADELVLTIVPDKHLPGLELRNPVYFPDWEQLFDWQMDRGPVQHCLKNEITYARHTYKRIFPCTGNCPTCKNEGRCPYQRGVECTKCQVSTETDEEKRLRHLEEDREERNALYGR